MADATGGRVVWYLEAVSNSFNAGLEAARKKIREFKDSLNNAFKAEKINAWAEDASQAINRYTKRLALAVTATAAFAIKSASDYEQSRIAFDTMLGSAEDGRKMLKDISQFARRTPFELPEVVTGAKQLLAYNIAGEKILPTFEALGNIAAGVGKDKLPNLILAFGQVRSATRLMGTELRQFREAGVPLVEILAKQLGVTEAAIEDMVSEGKIGFPEVEKAIFGMSQEGGKFFNLMGRQSGTFGGVVSNIRDNIGRLARSIVGITEEGDIVENSIFAKLSEAGQRLLVWLDKNSDNITKSLQGYVNEMLRTGEEFTTAFAQKMRSDGFASAVTESLIEMIGKVDWSRFVATSVAILFAIAPDIILGLGRGLIQAAINNPLDFAVLFALLGFTPAIVTAALATVLGGIPIIGPVLSWVTTGFSAAAKAATAPIAASYSAAGSVAAGAFSAALTAGLLVAVAAAAAIVAKAVMDAKRDIDSAMRSVNNLKSSTADAFAKIDASTRLTPEQKEEQKRKLAQSLAGNALGTSNWRGGPTWVGERGPEIVNLPKGSEVIPNHKIGDMGQKAEYNIGTINISSEVDGERWLKKLTRNQEIIDNGLIPSRGAI